MSTESKRVLKIEARAVEAIATPDCVEEWLTFALFLAILWVAGQ